MERSDIRDRLLNPKTRFPHFAEFTFGRAFGATRWLNAGYRFAFSPG